MTTTANPLAPAAQPSMYDRWLLRLAADPRLRRLYAWLAPVLVPLLAAILRHRDRFAGKRVGAILSGGNVDLDATPWRA